MSWSFAPGPEWANNVLEPWRRCGSNLVHDSVARVTCIEEHAVLPLRAYELEGMPLVQAVVDHQGEVGNLSGRADGLLRSREPINELGDWNIVSARSLPVLHPEYLQLKRRQTNKNQHDHIAAALHGFDVVDF